MRSQTRFSIFSLALSMVAATVTSLAQPRSTAVRARVGFVRPAARVSSAPLAPAPAPASRRLLRAGAPRPNRPTTAVLQARLRPPAPEPATVEAAPAATPTPGPAPTHTGLPTVTDVLRRIEQTMQSTRYSHDNRIDPLMGRYDVDAPGVATFVLRRTAPRAHQDVFARVRARSPGTREFHDVIAAAPTERTSESGWVRIPSASALQAGDVIAWRRPGTGHSNGHVAFVVSTPVRTTERGGGWLVRVADAAPSPHGDETRGPRTPRHHGLGEGTLLLVTGDASDEAPRAFGWTGSGSRTITPASIELGRPVR